MFLLEQTRDGISSQKLKKKILNRFQRKKSKIKT